MKDFLVAKYDWNSQYALDPEKNIHNPDLYKVWNEKINFMKIVTEMYPMENNYYVWADIGIVRSKLISPFLRYFPDKELEKNKMYFLRTRNIDINGYHNNLINVSHIKSHIGAGIIAGYKDVIKNFHEKGKLENKAAFLV